METSPTCLYGLQIFIDPFGLANVVGAWPRFTKPSIIKNRANINQEASTLDSRNFSLWTIKQADSN